MTDRIETYAIAGRPVPAKNGVWVHIADHDERVAHTLAQSDQVIDHMSDLIAHFSEQAAAWQRTALAALEENARLKTELAAARAEIEHLRSRTEDRIHDC